MRICILLRLNHTPNSLDKKMISTVSLKKLRHDPFTATESTATGKSVFAQGDAPVYRTPTFAITLSAKRLSIDLLLLCRSW